MADRRRVTKALEQILLRMVPFVPANEFRALYKALTEQNSEIDRQVEDAIESIKRSSETVSRLESDLKDRMQRLQDLRSEHQRMSKLAEISQDQSAALIAILQSTIGRNATKERWIALLINLFAGTTIFLVGVVAGPSITRWLGLSP